eukprot:tig00021521_g22078.t1
MNTLDGVSGLVNYLQAELTSMGVTLADINKFVDANCPAAPLDSLRNFQIAVDAAQLDLKTLDSSLDEFEDSLVLVDDEAYADIAEIAHMQIADSGPDAIECDF